MSGDENFLFDISHLAKDNIESSNPDIIHLRWDGSKIILSAKKAGNAKYA